MQIQNIPSQKLFRPLEGKLYPFQRQFPSLEELNASQEIAAQIQNYVTQPQYPNIAALQSYHKDCYQVGIYGRLGSAESWRELRSDLMFFADKLKDSPDLKLWAVFEQEDFSEEDFEAALWVELAMLTSQKDLAKDWAQAVSKEGYPPRFRVSLSDTDFYVMGLHSQSPFVSRKSKRPTLIFSLAEAHVPEWE